MKLHPTPTISTRFYGESRFLPLLFCHNFNSIHFETLTHYFATFFTHYFVHQDLPVELEFSDDDSDDNSYSRCFDSDRREQRGAQRREKGPRFPNNNSNKQPLDPKRVDNSPADSRNPRELDSKKKKKRRTKQKEEEDIPHSRQPLGESFKCNRQSQRSDAHHNVAMPATTRKNSGKTSSRKLPTKVNGETDPKQAKRKAKKSKEEEENVDTEASKSDSGSDTEVEEEDHGKKPPAKKSKTTSKTPNWQ